MCCHFSFAQNCFSRTIVWFLNLALMVAGIGGVVFGSLLLASKYGELLKDLSIVVICFGAFLMVLSMFAICGASCKRTKKCYMVIYCTVLLVLLLGQIGVVCVFIVRQSDLKNFLRDRWTNDLNDDQRDQIQRTLDCGVYDKEFSSDSLSWSLWEAMISSDGEKSAEAESIVEDIKSEGEIELDAAFFGEDFNTETFDHCFKKMKKEFKNLGAVAILIGLGVIGLQAISLIASCVLLCEDEEYTLNKAAPVAVAAGGAGCCGGCCCGIFDGCLKECLNELMCMACESFCAAAADSIEFTPYEV